MFVISKSHINYPDPEVVLSFYLSSTMFDRQINISFIFHGLRVVKSLHKIFFHISIKFCSKLEPNNMTYHTI